MVGAVGQLHGSVPPIGRGRRRAGLRSSGPVRPARLPARRASAGSLPDSSREEAFIRSRKRSRPASEEKVSSAPVRTWRTVPRSLPGRVPTKRMTNVDMVSAPGSERFAFRVFLGRWRAPLAGSSATRVGCCPVEPPTKLTLTLSAARYAGVMRSWRGVGGGCAGRRGLHTAGEAPRAGGAARGKCGPTCGRGSPRAGEVMKSARMADTSTDHWIGYVHDS